MCRTGKPYSRWHLPGAERQALSVLTRMCDLKPLSSAETEKHWFPEAKECRNVELIFKAYKNPNWTGERRGFLFQGLLHSMVSVFNSTQSVSKSLGELISSALTTKMIGIWMMDMLISLIELFCIVPINHNHLLPYNYINYNLPIYDYECFRQ